MLAERARVGRRLFEAARAPKALWLVEGAGHVDLHRFAGSAYQRRVLRFLEEHLGDGPSPARNGPLPSPK